MKPKKLLSVLLATVMLLTCIPLGAVSVSADDWMYLWDVDLIEGEDYWYFLTDGKATIVRYCGNSTVVRFPSTIDGYPVVEISGYWADDVSEPESVFPCDEYVEDEYSYEYYYGYNTTVTEVIIPDSVTEIGNFAFYHCTALSKVSLPDSVIEIERGAFQGCTALYSIDLPSALTSLEDEAFSNSNLSSITIPGSVTAVDGFSYCKNLTDVVIEEGVTWISAGAFSHCTSLGKISVPDSVIAVFDDFYDTLFYNDPTNWEDGLLYLDKHLIAAKNNAVVDCVVKPGTISITADFSGTAYSNTSLVSITIPASVKYLGNVFSNCRNVSKIYISDITAWCEMMGGSLIQRAHELYLNGELITDLVIPEGITAINGTAFQYCSNLTSVTIPDSVTTVASYAFYQCTGLETVTIGDGVTTIGERTFGYCSSLASVTLGESVTTIGLRAFEGCSSLVSVDFPDSVTEIGVELFYNCSDLTAVTFGNNVTTIGDRAFSGNNISSLVLPDSVIQIGTSAFSGCTSLTSLTIGNNVASIGSGAFCKCWRLTSVHLPASVTRVEGAFESCSDLTAVTVAEDNPSYCSIDGVLYNKDVTRLCLYPQAKKDACYVIPNGVCSIDEQAFEDCYNLRSIVLPVSVTSVGTDRIYAFDGCYYLEDVWYTGSQNDRENITFASDYDSLLSATWHYNTCAEEHTYNDACDDSCNLCEWVRNDAAEHVYDNLFDDTCNMCGIARERNYISMNTDTPITIVNGGDVADFLFIPEETGSYTFYSFNEDGSNADTYGYLLDVNGDVLVSDDGSGGDGHFAVTYTMEAGTPYVLRAKYYSTYSKGSFLVRLERHIHVYDNNHCDEYCNTCDEWREVTHNYDNNCDYNCNTCGRWRDAPHNYDDACDVMCNDCFYLTWIVLAHEYDDITDTDCNLCGDVREYLDLDEEATVDIDEYGDAAFFLFTPEEDGYYTFSSDTGLAYGEIFAVASGYGFSATGYLEAGETYILMAMCRNKEGIVSGPFTVKMQKHTHTYTNDCDYYCNDSSCEAYRKAPPHNYENACDPDCNDCGNVRTDIHVWDDVCDTECNECGATRQVNYITVEQDEIAESVDGVPAEFVFIPEQSGIYTFYSTSDSDTYGYLLDANREELAHNDDGGEGNNFQITYSLVAGTPYILRCRFYGNGNGSFTVSADLTHPHVYDNECDSDCNDCEEERVAPHSYSGACDEYCNACGTKREGVASHDWADATYSAPKTCAVCGATEGDPLSQDGYSSDVAHSVMETDNGNGLAFWFELSAKGVVKERGNLANLSGATINYLGRECKLVAMGAVMTNNAAVGATAFTLEDVHGDNVIDVPAVYLQEADADSCAFAVRIIDIPDSALERTIYARPYYVVEVDGQQIIVYGDVDAASCADYL